MYLLSERLLDILLQSTLDNKTENSNYVNVNQPASEWVRCVVCIYEWVWRALLVLCAQSAPHGLSHTLVSAEVERGADRVTKQNSDQQLQFPHSLTPSLPLVLRSWWKDNKKKKKKVELESKKYVDNRRLKKRATDHPRWRKQKRGSAELNIYNVLQTIRYTFLITLTAGILHPCNGAK